MADLEKGVERLLAFAGAQTMLEGARPERPGEEQAGPGAPADQQGPPVHTLPLAAARHGRGDREGESVGLER